MKNFRKPIVLVCSCLILAVFLNNTVADDLQFVGSSYSVTKTKRIPSTRIISYNISNSTELSQFLDDYIPTHLEKSHTPGFTISVVKDKEIVLTKGYGYANLEEKTPVIANTTLFRIGSVSKSFIATAVYQLVEKGLLDLNEDINTYLTTFQIPSTFETAITLNHLLSHTPGFEEWHTPVIEFEPINSSLAVFFED